LEKLLEGGPKALKKDTREKKGPTGSKNKVPDKGVALCAEAIRRRRKKGITIAGTLFCFDTHVHIGNLKDRGEIRNQRRTVIGGGEEK